VSRDSGLLRRDDATWFLTFRRNLSASSSSVQGARKPNSSCTFLQNVRKRSLCDAEDQNPTSHRCENLTSRNTQLWTAFIIIQC